MCKFIQIINNTYLGIGYLGVHVKVSTHPSFANFWFSGPYIYAGKQASTNELENLVNKDLMNGK